MSKTKHTPGPWYWETRKVGRVVRTVVQDDAGEIAEAYGEDRAECEANASLIAAAPELLHALENLVAATAAIQWPEIYDKASFIDAARSAIKKATEGNQ